MSSFTNENNALAVAYLGLRVEYLEFADWAHDAFFVNYTTHSVFLSNLDTIVVCDVYIVSDSFWFDNIGTYLQNNPKRLLFKHTPSGNKLSGYGHLTPFVNYSPEPIFLVSLKPLEFVEYVYALQDQI